MEGGIGAELVSPTEPGEVSREESFNAGRGGAPAGAGVEAASVPVPGDMLRLKCLSTTLTLLRKTNFFVFKSKSQSCEAAVRSARSISTVFFVRIFRSAT